MTPANDSRADVVLDLIARLEKESRPSRELDEAIRAYVKARPSELHASGSTWFEPELYTASIDAALTLYRTVPERVPSNPIKVCIEALNDR